jgi:FecR protein
MIKRGAALVFGIAATVSLSGGVQADTQRVGVTSAVNPSVAGTPPGAPTRQLVVGNDVVFRERVITTDEGQAQILFLDQSALMIGPNSTVVIDEFVYDPSTSKGNIAATLTQGSFRYIGGKLSKQGNATLKTPVATIGIRGSDVTVLFDAARSLMDVITTHGTANVETLVGTLGLRTGFGASVGAIDRPPGPATALTAAQIAAANKVFEGQPGKSGGASQVPTDESVADSELSTSIKAQALAAIEPAAGTNLAIYRPINLPVLPPPRPEDNGVSPTVPVVAATSNNNNGGSNSGDASGSRVAQTLNGYIAGFGERSSNGSYSSYSGHHGIRALTNDSPSDVEIRTIPDADGVGRVHATFNFRSTGSGSLSASIEMGDPPSPGNVPATKSIFVNNTTFFAVQDAAAAAEVAWLNGHAAKATVVMVSAPAIPLSEIEDETPGNLPCSCEFVTWGVWQATLEAPQKSLDIPLALWVAGKLPSVSDPSPQGSATFSGTALGMVQKRSESYFASGAFANTYNFSQRTGNVSITNFDGKSFGGTVNAGSDWRSYSGSLSGSNLNGSINGSFYGNRNAAGQLQVPQETAGNFNVGKHGYSASGIFIGKR